MLAIDLTLDPSTAIAADAADAKTYSLISQESSKAVRSRADVATTTPHQLTTSHSTRTVKGMRSVANSSVSGQDVVFDRHMIRLDRNIAQTLVLDPTFKVNAAVYLVIEVPRLGASTPTLANVAGDIKRIIAMLLASSNANLQRILNWES